MKNFRYWHVFAVIIIVLLGLALRLYMLDSESLWLDEGYAFYEINKGNLKGVLMPFVDGSTAEGSPALYFAFMHYWTRIFGFTEFYLRLPSAVFSSLAIVFVYLLGSMLFNRKAGIISSFLISVSAISIVYAQEFRPYAMLSFFSLASLYFFARMIKNESYKIVNRALYAVFTLLMLYTHYLGFFILFFEAAMFALFYKKVKINIKAILFTFLLLALFYLPGLYVFFGQIEHNQGAVQRSLSNKLGVPDAVSDLGLGIFAAPIIITALVLLLAFAFRKNFSRLYKRIKFNDSALFIAFLAFFALYFLYGLKLISSVFITRYTHFSYPIFYILASAGFLKMRRYYKIILVFIFLALTISSLFTYYNEQPRKEQWKEAAEFIEASYRNGELTVIVDGDASYLLDYYRKTDIDMLPVKARLDEEAHESIYQNIKGKYPAYWLVLSHAQNAKGFYNEKLNSDYDMIKEKHFKGIDIYYFMGEQ